MVIRWDNYNRWDILTTEPNEPLALSARDSISQHIELKHTQRESKSSKNRSTKRGGIQIFQLNRILKAQFTSAFPPELILPFSALLIFFVFYLFWVRFGFNIYIYLRLHSPFYVTFYNLAMDYEPYDSSGEFLL